MMKKPILRDAQIHFSPIDHESRLGKDLVQIDTKSEDFVSKCASAWNRLLPKQYRSTHAFRCFSTCTCHHYWICHKNSFFRVPIKPIHKITSVECGFMGHIRTNSFKLFYDVELMPQLKTTKGDSFPVQNRREFFQRSTVNLPQSREFVRESRSVDSPLRPNKTNCGIICINNSFSCSDASVYS